MLQLTEKNLKKEVVYAEAANLLVPKVYQKLIAQENLRPIIQPSVELVSAEENKDWDCQI